MRDPPVLLVVRLCDERGGWGRGRGEEKIGNVITGCVKRKKGAVCVCVLGGGGGGRKGKRNCVYLLLPIKTLLMTS